ncbi:MAG: hypothetical protein KDB54_01845 [Solirubrobacterales bacterium]|nr:hypothetical protein [Solirubrobacterales bacterium]
MTSTLRVIVIAVGTVLLALVPAHAFAAWTGSISGQLTVAGQAAPNVCVSATDSTDLIGNSSRFALSDSQGKYTVNGLATGSYRLAFFTSDARIETPTGLITCDQGNVLTQYYEDQANPEAATLVSVTNGSDTPNVDAHLAKGGSVSGRVTVGSKGPNGGVCVVAHDPTDWPVFQTRTDVNGDYSLAGLDTGNYRVAIQGCGEESNVIGERSIDVHVTAGSDTAGVDAHMDLGGSISGLISAPDLHGTCWSDIEVFDAAGSQVASHSNPFSEDYKFTKLRPGTYRLRFDVSCVGRPMSGEAVTHQGEFFSDQETLASATPVSVAEGEDVDGINVTLGMDESKPGSPEGTARKAKIGALKVRGPAKVKKGRRLVERVTITNTGGRIATGVVLQVKGRGVRYRASLGSIRAGHSRVFTAKLCPRKAGRARLTFKVNSSNAGRKSARRVIAVSN